MCLYFYGVKDCYPYEPPLVCTRQDVLCVMPLLLLIQVSNSNRTVTTSLEEPWSCVKHNQFYSFKFLQQPGFTADFYKSEWCEHQKYGGDYVSAIV